MQKDRSLAVRPIGYVRNEFVNRGVFSGDARMVRSFIDIEPEFADGLMDLEKNLLIAIIFYFHEAEGFELKIHPRGDESRPITGLFNTRSPRRPSPIGITVVKLISIEGNRLLVEGLDAVDGTPVIDIKPLIRSFDEGYNGPGEDRTYRDAE
jgi:tRNA (adenine37-N6)-methyltransferase